jgi:Tfp pilus assembly protein PilF
MYQNNRKRKTPRPFSNIKRRPKASQGATRRQIKNSNSTGSPYKKGIFRLVTLTGIVIVIIFLVSIYEILTVDYLIKPFTVPEDFKKRGISGEVIGAKLLDQINKIKTEAENLLNSPTRLDIPGKEDLKLYVVNPDWTEIDFKLPETGISIKSFLRYILKPFGITETLISGNVVSLENNKIELTVRLNNVSPQISINSSDSFYVELQDHAEFVYKSIQPYLLAVYYINSDPNNCLETLQYILSNKSNKEAALALNLWGNILIENGEYDNAIKKFEEADSKYSPLSTVYSSWGIALTALENYESAIDKFKEAENTGSLNYYMFINFGIVLHDLGNHKEAIEKYKKAIDLNPEFIEAYLGWGIELTILEKYEEAIQKYEIVLKLNPEGSVAEDVKGMIRTLKRIK